MNLSSALSGQLMAVKTLKMKFRFFLTLTNHKLVFVTCKSVSVMTAPLSLLLQPKLIWLVVLFSIFCLYDFNAARFQKNSKCLDIFVLLVPFEILS